MINKLENLRKGLRLNINKPPKVETPKKVYTRKIKHKKGREENIPRPFLFVKFVKKTEIYNSAAA